MSAVHGAVSSSLGLSCSHLSIQLPKSSATSISIAIPHLASTAVAHLPSGGAILLHIPQLPSLFPHTSHPVRPTVLPFHPLSSAHCPLRCPLKTALAKNRRRGVGAAPRQGNPFRSPRLPTERSSLVVFFPFAFRTHAVLSRYRLIVKKAPRYAPPFQSTGTSVGSHSPSTSSAPAKQTPIHHRRVESVAPRLALRSHIPSSTRQTFVPPLATTLGLSLSDPSRPLPFSRPREPRRRPMATAP